MRKLLSLVSFLLLPAALFYLFVVPILVAADPQPGVGGYIATAFGAFLLLQVWMLVGLWAVESLAGLYGKRMKRLRRLRRWLAPLGETRHREAGASSPLQGVVLGLLSFLLTTYAFGVLYLFISRWDERAFGGGELGIGEAMYYGFATAVTYGDLNPLTNLARLAVVVQLAITLAYTIFMFSVFTGAIERAGRNHS